MTENERSSLQEQRAFFEAEWNNELERRLAEQKLRAKAETERDRLLQQLRQCQPQLQQASRVPDLEKKLSTTEQELLLLQLRLGELANLEVLQTQLKTAEQNLKRIQDRVSKETFWRRIAEEFAEDIENFPSIKGQYRDGNDAVVETIEAWNIEILEALHQAINRQHPDVTRVKRLLLAQWVLFRWFEITEVIE